MQQVRMKKDVVMTRYNENGSFAGVITVRIEDENDNSPRIR